MTQSRMLKFAMFAGVVITALLVVGAAQASVCTLSGPTYFGSFALNSNGTLGPSDCTSVVQQDKDWSNFGFSGLPAGTTVQFSFAKVGGQDIHTVTFLGPFGALAGSFNWSYDISVTPGPPPTLKDVASDIGQTRGSSSSMTMLMDNNSNSYMTNFTQIGTVTSGTTTVTFLPGVDMLTVNNVFTINAGGSDATSVSNSYTQAVIPEPASLGLLGTGLACLSLALRRRRL